MRDLTPEEKAEILGFDDAYRAERGTNGHTIRYQFIIVDGGMPFVTQVAVRRLKGKSPDIKIVAWADINTRAIHIGDIDFRPVAGWVTDWFWNSPLHSFNTILWRWNGILGWRNCPIVNPEALAETDAKFCGWVPALPLVDFLMLWSMEHKVEFVAKAGLYTLCNPTSVKRLVKCKDFFKFCREHAAEIKSGEWSAREIDYSFNHGVSCDLSRNHFEAVKIIVSHPFPRGAGVHAELIVRHADKHGLDLNAYGRYLSDAAKAGWDINEPSVFLPPPNGFKALCDRAEAEAAKAEIRKVNAAKREIAKAMKKTAAMYAGIPAKILGYGVFVPSTPGELLIEGKVMHNCVGKMGYDKKVAAGDSLIVALRRAGKSVCTIEIDLKRKSVRQCYAEHNSTPTKAMKNAAATILKSINKIANKAKKAA